MQHDGVAGRRAHRATSTSGSVGRLRADRQLVAGLQRRRPEPRQGVRAARPEHRRDVDARRGRRGRCAGRSAASRGAAPARPQVDDGVVADRRAVHRRRSRGTGQRDGQQGRRPDGQAAEHAPRRPRRPRRSRPAGWPGSTRRGRRRRTARRRTPPCPGRPRSSTSASAPTATTSRARSRPLPSDLAERPRRRGVASAGRRRTLRGAEPASMPPPRHDEADPAAGFQQRGRVAVGVPQPASVDPMSCQPPGDGRG